MNNITFNFNQLKKLFSFWITYRPIDADADTILLELHLMRVDVILYQYKPCIASYYIKNNKLLQTSRSYLAS